MTHAFTRHRAASHRAPRRRRSLPSPRALTAVAIGGALLSSGAAVATSGPAIEAEPAAAAPAAGERLDVSRDAERPPLTSMDGAVEAAADQAEKAAEKAKKAKAKQEKADEARRALEAAQKDPRGVAQGMLADYGWDAAQFTCLDALWVGESGWDHTATNPSSGAYGIPQSLPATKMATAGKDWETNPVTQIRWGLDYIRASYGTPCSANAFKSGNNWY